MNHIVSSLRTKDNIRALKSVYRGDAITHPSLSRKWSERQDEAIFFVNGQRSIKRGAQTQIGDAERGQKYVATVQASEIKDLLRSIDITSTFTNSFNSSWSNFNLECLNTFTWPNISNISSQSVNNAIGWQLIVAESFERLEEIKIKSQLKMQLGIDLLISYTKADINRFPVTLEARREAQWFIDSLPDTLTLMPSLAVGSDGEIDILWRGTEFWLDVGFYGEGEYSAVMQSIRNIPPESLEGQRPFGELPNEFLNWFDLLG